MAVALRNVDDENIVESSDREEYHTTDGSLSAQSDDQSDGSHQLRSFVEASMNKVAENIRERIPNFLNSPSTRHLSVLDRVQHIIDHTTTVHDENQTLKAENERLRQQAQLVSQSFNTEEIPCGESLKFEMWFRKEIKIPNEAYLDAFVSHGCNDLRLATSFNRAYLEQLGISDPIAQIRILSSLKNYPNWTLFEDWLVHEVGLECYIDLFVRMGLNDMNVIRSGFIDEKLLRQLGMSFPGHRKVFLMEMRRLESVRREVDSNGNPIPSVDALLQHLWGGIRNEIRDVLLTGRHDGQASRGHRKQRSRRWSPQNEANDLQVDEQRLRQNSATSYPGGPVTPQALPPSATISNGNDAVHATRICDGAGFPERGSILKRQSSADSRTSTIAPFFHHQGLTVPSAKNPYTEPTTRIARSYSAPNLSRAQSIPSLSSFKWHHKQILHARTPAEVRWSAPPGQTATTAQTAPMTGRVGQSVPRLSGGTYPNAATQRSTNATSAAPYREVRSLSASNLEAIREQHESEHRRRREHVEKLIEKSVMSPPTNGRENRTVFVNVIAPQGAWPARKSSNSAQSTEVNVGSRESSR